MNSAVIYFVLLVSLFGGLWLTLSASVIRIMRNILTSNVLAGIKMRLMRPYTPGDWVTVAGHHGRVMQVALTYTALKSDNLDRAIIPNSIAVSRVIINHSYIPGFPIAVTLPVEAGPHPADIADALLRCAAEFKPRLVRSDCAPTVSIISINCNTVTYCLRIYVPETLRGGDVEGQLRLSIIRALAGHGIKLGGCPC